MALLTCRTLGWMAVWTLVAMASDTMAMDIYSDYYDYYYEYNEYNFDEHNAVLEDPEWLNSVYGCIWGYNDLQKYTNVSLEQCKENCALSFGCKSIEFDKNLYNGQCWMSTQTKKTMASKWRKPCDWSYFIDVKYLERLAVDGDWSEWSEYSQCTKQCGGGHQTRTRKCTNPEPGEGGRTCDQQKNKDDNFELATETRDCNTFGCVCGWYKSCLGMVEDTCPQGNLKKCRCVKKNKKTKKTIAKGDGVMVDGKCSCSQFCPKGSNCEAMLYCCGGEENEGKAFKKAATIGGTCN